ncbi:MAG TPA: serpin family protein [Longimicrobiales bacterium]
MRRGVRVFALGCAAVALASCELVFGPDRDAAPLERLPRDLSAAEQAVIAGSNTFAFDILRATAERDTSQNVMLSPLSASMALGMTLNGARGQTFDEMRDVLGFAGLEQDAINASYESLIDLLLGLDDAIDMRIGNSVWARSGVPFHSTFMDAVRQAFAAEVASLDFSAPDASATINDWVDRSTNGRIRRIVPDAIPDDVVMYLINAIYFKGSWTEQFDPARTRDAPFQRADGSTTTVRMMSREKRGMHYYADADVEVAELRYGRGAWVMDIVLPRQGTIDEVIASLDEARWNTWLGGLHESNVQLGLPKFRLEYETRMNDALVALGMVAAFTDHVADFTGLSPIGDQLVITEVRQKTFMNVDEEGTEAAAATSVGIGVTSAPPRMVVDRPFLVAIRERFSGSILFIGKVGSP